MQRIARTHVLTHSSITHTTKTEAPEIAKATVPAAAPAVVPAPARVAPASTPASQPTQGPSGGGGDYTYLIIAIALSVFGICGVGYGLCAKRRSRDEASPRSG